MAICSSSPRDLLINLRTKDARLAHFFIHVQHGANQFARRPNSIGTASLRAESGTAPKLDSQCLTMTRGCIGAISYAPAPAWQEIAVGDSAERVAYEGSKTLTLEAG